MKKRGIVAWVFIMFFALLSISLLAVWFRSNVMLLYSLLSGILAYVLYKESKNGNDERKVEQGC